MKASYHDPSDNLISYKKIYIGQGCEGGTENVCTIKGKLLCLIL